MTHSRGSVSAAEQAFHKYMCGMTHEYVCHDSLVSIVYDMAHSHVCAMTHRKDMTHSHGVVSGAQHAFHKYMWDMTREYADVTHEYVVVTHEYVDVTHECVDVTHECVDVNREYVFMT